MYYKTFSKIVLRNGFEKRFYRTDALYQQIEQLKAAIDDQAHRREILALATQSSRGLEAASGERQADGCPAPVAPGGARGGSGGAEGVAGRAARKVLQAVQSATRSASARAGRRRQRASTASRRVWRRSAWRWSSFSRPGARRVATTRRRHRMRRPDRRTIRCCMTRRRQWVVALMVARLRQENGGGESGQGRTGRGTCFYI